MVDSREACLHLGIDRETFVDCARELIDSGLVQIEGAWVFVVPAIRWILTINGPIQKALLNQVRIAPQNIGSRVVSKYSYIFSMVFVMPYREKVKDTEFGRGPGETQNTATGPKMADRLPYRVNGQAATDSAPLAGPAASVPGQGETLPEGFAAPDSWSGKVPQDIVSAWLDFPRRPRGSWPMYLAACATSPLSPGQIKSGLAMSAAAVSAPKFLSYIERIVASGVLASCQDKPKGQSDPAARSRLIDSLRAAGYTDSMIKDLGYLD